VLNELVSKNPSSTICDEPLVIPAGLFAILSQVVCVIDPLKTYLVSYDPVNCSLPETIPFGIFVNPVYDICELPDTKVGLLVKLTN